MECWFCGSKRIKKQVIGVGDGSAIEYYCEDCFTVQEEEYDNPQNA